MSLGQVLGAWGFRPYSKYIICRTENEELKEKINKLNEERDQIGKNIDNEEFNNKINELQESVKSANNKSEELNKIIDNLNKEKEKLTKSLQDSETQLKESNGSLEKLANVNTSLLKTAKKLYDGLKGIKRIDSEFSETKQNIELTLNNLEKYLKEITNDVLEKIVERVKATQDKELIFSMM